MADEKKSVRRGSGLRDLMRIAGPVVTVLGIIVVAFSAFDFASAAGTEQASKLNITAQRTLKAPTYGWIRWVGMTVIAAGVVMTAIGFEIFTGRKEEPEQEAPKRKSIGEPLGGIKKQTEPKRPASSQKPKG